MAGAHIATNKGARSRVYPICRERLKRVGGPIEPPS